MVCPANWKYMARKTSFSSGVFSLRSLTWITWKLPLPFDFSFKSRVAWNSYRLFLRRPRAERKARTDSSWVPCRESEERHFVVLAHTEQVDDLVAERPFVVVAPDGVLADLQEPIAIPLGFQIMELCSMALCVQKVSIQSKNN